MAKVKFTVFQKEVLYLLINFPDTRVNDHYLYYKYIDNHGVTLNQVFGRYSKMILKSNKVASFGTIERIRRKLQAEHPELKDIKTDINRQNQTENYIKYAFDYNNAAVEI